MLHRAVACTDASEFESLVLLDVVDRWMCSVDGLGVFPPVQRTNCIVAGAKDNLLNLRKKYLQVFTRTLERFLWCHRDLTFNELANPMQLTSRE